MLELNIDKGIISPEKKSEAYETVIIGAGPAGLTAAIYTSRAQIHTLLIEKLGAGGQAAATDHIENYPGFPEGVNGFELSQKMEEQALKFGARIENAEVMKVEKNTASGLFQIKTDGKTYETRSIILAAGTCPKKLGIKGEDSFIGRGISFCATCDGAFYKDKTVAVIGGGDSALDEGLFLTRFAKKVYIIHRRDKLRAVKILQKRALENPKIEIIWNTIVEEVIGDTKIRQLRIQDLIDCESRILDVDGMFLYIGINPNTTIIEGVNKDNQGYIITDEAMLTSIPGVFAAGDCRKTPLRQVVTAVGDGAIAAYSAEKFLDETGK
jgi:thioredoxin reductase (NADPH)